MQGFDLSLYVVVLKAKRPGRPKQKYNGGVAAMTNRKDNHGLIRNDVAMHAFAQLMIVCDRVPADIAAKIAAEPVFLTESDMPDVRVLAVGADHQLKVSRVAAFECDVHSAGMLIHTADGIAEHEVAASAQASTEDPHKFATHDLDLFRSELTRDPVEFDLPRTQPRRNHHTTIVACTPLLELGKQSHPFKDVECRAPKVDRVAASPKSGGLLHDGRPEAVASQPPGENQTGDAGT